MALDNIFFFIILSIFANYILVKKNFFLYKLLLDKDFLKPQAFHNISTPRSGGIVILLITVLYLSFFENINNFSYSVILLGTLFFLIGFLDDFKINFKPELRLLFMFIISFFIIYLFEIKISYTQIKFLDNIINYNNVFSVLFVCFCILFIVNGSNFIDGFNGLLVIQYLIILTILYLLICKIGDLNYLKNFILLSLILGFVFLFFNFPKSRIFLGDGGAYFLGINLSLIIIEINKYQSKIGISPFLFACLLFYIFFEVFFSFFRKIFFKKNSPMKPDSEHLHMLLFIFINNKINNKIKSNYLTSIVVNLFYIFFISPLAFIYKNGAMCKIYFFSLLFFYLICYFFLSGKQKYFK